MSNRIYKRWFSVVLAVMLIVSSLVCSGVISAGAEGSVITYSFVVTGDAVCAFEGSVNYPDSALSVESVTVYDGKTGDTYYNDNDGVILFNTSTSADSYDFTDGKALITVSFNVIGEYNPDDITLELKDFYNLALLQGGNVPYRYAKVIDGEVVESGGVDIDHPENNYTDIVYTVVYSYNDGTSDLFKTKTVRTPETDALTIAKANVPGIVSPYYTYSVGSAEINGTTINVTLAAKSREYTVTCGGDVQSYSYMEQATITSDTDTGYLIDGNVVAVGKSFTFYVTGNTEVLLDSSFTQVTDRASISFNGMTISDEKISMGLLATTKAADFARMGVAFAVSERSTEDIVTAISNVTASGTGSYDKIAVHNSTVDSPNVSGQYQFIFAPYVSTEKAVQSQVTNLYFYTFVVDTSGNVKVSDVPVIINLANAVA